MLNTCLPFLNCKGPRTDWCCHRRRCFHKLLISKEEAAVHSVLFIYIYIVLSLQLVRTQPLHKDSINKSCWGLQEQRLNVGTTQTVLLHESAATILYFEGEKLWVLSHPPYSYSPDLAPHDLWIFFTLKTGLALAGKVFLQLQDFAGVANSQLHAITTLEKLEYHNTFPKCLRGMQLCMDCNREYCEHPWTFHSCTWCKSFCLGIIASLAKHPDCP